VSAPARPGTPGADALFAFAPDRARALAAEHGTPCFVYDVRRAEQAFLRLSAALPPRVTLAFAVKANPHPALLARLAALGARFDCASAGELRRAAAALAGAAGPPAPGAAPRLLYAGPGKREAELALALALGARVQAEGWEDLQRVDALVAASGTPRRDGAAAASVDVNLRVHPRLAPAEERALLGGSGPSAFGVDEEDVPELLARAAALTGVRVTGLHVFAATNQRDASALLAAWAHVFELGRSLQHEHGLQLAQIDLGGGLGVPYAADETPLDVGALGAGLAALLARHAWFGGEVLLEPGRYIAAACGDYLVRVVRTKHSRGTRFAILEGGINHLLRPLLTGQPFPVRRVGRAAPGGGWRAGDEAAPASRRPADEEAAPAGRRPADDGAGDGPLRSTVLAGPLCTALDRLGEVALPELAPGDLLAFGMVGAYGATEAMADFLSHPRAAEVWVGDGGG